MPALGRELGESGAMSHHAFDKVVGHGETDIGPSAAAVEIAAGNERRDGDPCDEQRGLENAAGSGAENEDREGELDESDQSEESSAQRERFDSFRFNDAAEQLTGALMADAIRTEAQGAEEQTLLNASAGGDRDLDLQPGDEDAERDEHEKQERPEPEPASIGARIENIPADDPPGENPEEVLDGMGAGKGEQALGNVGAAELKPKVGRRRKAKKRDAADGSCGETFAENGRARGG